MSPMSGIPTIRRVMREYGLPEPRFENRRNEFLVTLFNGTAITTAPQKTERVSEGINLLNFCRVPQTRQRIADYLGVKTIFYVMSHCVRPLLQDGKLAKTLPETPKRSGQKFYTV